MKHQRTISDQEFEQAWGLIEKLVYKTWHSLQGTHSCMEFSDFMNEARLTALKCIRKYDPDSPYKFQTYAMSSIRNRFYRIMRLDRGQRSVTISELAGDHNEDLENLRDSIYADLSVSLFQHSQSEIELRGVIDSIISRLCQEDEFSARIFEKRIELYRTDPDMPLCQVYSTIRKSLKLKNSISSIRRRFSPTGLIGRTVYTALGVAA